MSRIRNIWQRPVRNIKSDEMEKQEESVRVTSPYQRQVQDIVNENEIEEESDFEFDLQEEEESSSEEEPIQALIEALRQRTGTDPSLRRRQCISVCVNDQDEAVFRASAHKANMTLSAWAREAMYKHAGVRLRRNSKKMNKKK